jgi:hypothetical protein
MLRVRRAPRAILEASRGAIVSMYLRGESTSTISKAFGASIGLTAKLLKEFGVTLRSRSEGTRIAFTEARKLAYSARMMSRPSGAIGKRWTHKYHPKPWMKGALNIHWKGGRTPLCQKIRNSDRYSKWRSSVFLRDDFTCQECGRRGGRLQADHRVAFSSIMDSCKIVEYEQAMTCDAMWDVSNGRTLCFACHKKTPNYAGRAFRKA